MAYANQKTVGRLFSILSFIAFDRSRSLLFSASFVFLSFIAEWKLGWVNFFSCSGAIVTLSGLFLNIKHSLHFHLNLPKESLYYMLFDVSSWGSEPSEEDLKKVDSVLADESYGVAFMVIGTLIWAYGGFLIIAIKGHSVVCH